MSVAMGTPHPAGANRPAKARYKAAGTNMPPNAATSGSAAFRRLFSSPTRSSRLISNPTSRKNAAMRKSLTHKRAGISSALPATWIEIGAAQTDAHAAAHGEFARNNAATVAAMSIEPARVSVRRNRSKGRNKEIAEATAKLQVIDRAETPHDRQEGAARPPR